MLIKTINLVSLILTLFIFQTGCGTANVVSSPNDSYYTNAPSADVTEPGIIKYFNRGPEFTIKERREEAYEKMQMECNGSYQILSEGPSAATAVTKSGKGVLYKDEDYWYIKFLCTN